MAQVGSWSRPRWVSAQSSWRARSRLQACNQAKLRSMTYRWRPRAEARGMLRRPNARRDAAVAEQAPVLVVAAVGQQAAGPLRRPTKEAGDRWDRLDKRDELGNAVAVAAGQGDGERNAVVVADQVMLGAGLSPVHRGWPGVGPPLSVRTWEESTKQHPRSSLPATRSSASISVGSVDRTLASLQSCSRRQHVTPEQPQTFRGSWFDAMPVPRTNTIPTSAGRPSARLQPGYRCRRVGRASSSGATRSPSESGARSSITRQTAPYRRSSKATPALIQKRSLSGLPPIRSVPGSVVRSSQRVIFMRLVGGRAMDRLSLSRCALPCESLTPLSPRVPERSHYNSALNGKSTAHA
jgi:hypothetical protein